MAVQSLQIQLCPQYCQMGKLIMHRYMLNTICVL